jgi:ABC-type enterochelin transport system substrate-binding protein
MRDLPIPKETIMTFKREIIALIVRVAADKTSLVRKPEPFEMFLGSIFGTETYDQQLARKIEADLDRGVNAIKRVNTNRKFKKITQDF